jgi:predicted  nucleic acid-binding Zn-ribbon protein
VKKPHRCQDCGKHFSLRRICDTYVVARRCPQCGSARIRYDMYEYHRRIKRRRTETCDCIGMPFPHRRASTPFCWASEREPTEDEFIDERRRYGP